MVEILIRLGLLEKLQKDLVPNATQISSLFLAQDYDPENTYSLPYAWSVTGIVTHKELRAQEIQSWKDLLELPELRGKISLLDDARETMGMALKALGFSYNSTDLGELKLARDWLIRNRGQIKMFRSEMVDALIRKEVVAAQAYSTDARQAMQKSAGQITFALPKEGTTFAIDNFIIVKGSKNTLEAHRLMNFIFEPQNYAKLISHIHAGAVVTEAAHFLAPEKAANKLFFPDAETLSRFERLKEIGPFQREFERAWGQVKAAR
jgi:spermidine/putrescine transport system substrate-binding protein